MFHPHVRCAEKPVAALGKEGIEPLIGKRGQTKMAALLLRRIGLFAIRHLVGKRQDAGSDNIDRIGAARMVAGKAQMPPVIYLGAKGRDRGKGVGFDFGNLLQHETS